MKEITGRLEEVAASNDINLDQDARSLIARRANGGLRDALSTLDQIISYKGKNISKKDVMDVLGLVDDVFLASLMDAVFSQDAALIIELIGQAISQGKEAPQLARETALYLRDLLLYTIMGKDTDFRVASNDSLVFLEKQKNKAEKEQIMEALRKIMDVTDKLRFSEGQRFLLEIAFLELSEIFSSERKEPQKRKTSTKKPVNPEKAEKDDARNILWGKILAGVKEKKIPTHALLAQGKLLGVKDDILYIGFKKNYKFHKEKMEEKPNREIMENVIRELFQREMESQFIFVDDEQYNDIIVKKAIEYFGEDIVEIKD